MSIENYAKMMQFDEGIKKINTLGKKLWPKQKKGQFSFVFSDISFINEKVQIYALS